MRLPLGDINVVAVTDVHSWVAGHGFHHETAAATTALPLNADYGDVLSFFQTVQHRAAAQGKDVFLVMNGDFVDGTGLSGVPPEHLTPILQRMPFDSVNLGNHELYHNETMAFLRDSGFLEHWKGNFLTTNTFWESTGDPIGNQYTYMHGTISNVKILAFGFLYNFKDNCKSTVVRNVQDIVQMDWFRDVLFRRDYDAILVLGHMDVVDSLVGIIHRRIRAIIGPDMPIQFINGHSHRRAFHRYDKLCYAFEPGHFLDTVGYVTFPTYATVQGSSDSPQSLFHHVFLDANKKKLQNAVETYNKTKQGQTLSNFIHETENSLGIENVVGCSETTFHMLGPFDAVDSIYSLCLQQVLPFAFQWNESRTFIQTPGALRYGLFRGEVTVDDLIKVSPFEDLIYLTATNIAGSDLMAAFGHLLATSRDPHRGWPYPSYVISGHGINTSQFYDLYTTEYDLEDVRRRLQRVIAAKLPIAKVFRHGDGSCITTSSIWQSFVVCNWPCPMAIPSRRLVDQDHAYLPVSVATTFLFLLVALTVFTQSKPERQTTGRCRSAVPDYGSMKG